MAGNSSREVSPITTLCVASKRGGPGIGRTGFPVQAPASAFLLTLIVSREIHHSEFFDTSSLEPRWERPVHEQLGTMAIWPSFQAKYHPPRPHFEPRGLTRQARLRSGSGAYTLG